jgi:hypothetical protein
MIATAPDFSLRIGRVDDSRLLPGVLEKGEFVIGVHSSFSGRSLRFDWALKHGSRYDSRSPKAENCLTSIWNLKSPARTQPATAAIGPSARGGLGLARMPGSVRSLRQPLERLSFERNRSKDKKSLKIKTLEQALIEKVYQLF